jgi:hypothetical protein
LGNVIERLEPDAQLEIVGGPICNDSYIWWQTQLPNTDVIGWTVEGTFETLFLTPVDESIEIPELQAQVDLALPGLPPGVYFVHMLAPETEALDYEPIEHIAVVATANITLKRSAGQVLAWVTDMESGDPVPDASVQFYDADFRLLAIVRTDADGIAVLNSRRLEQPQQVYAVVQDEDNFGFVTNSWSNGIGNGGFISYATTPSNLTTYLYTERPLYRPDQTVYFRGIVRNRDDVTLRIPPDIKTVTVQIFNSGNEVVFEDDLPLTDYGTFSGEFKLDAEAALGGYRIRVDFDVTDNYIPTFYFNVAEYVAPEFQMSVTPAEPEVIQGDLADVLVESSYFFGGGVSHAEVKWTVITNNYYFNYAGEGRYSFADVDEDFRTFNYSDGYGEHITEGESETDSQGRFLIQVPTDLNDRSQSQVFTIEAQISEESSHYVVARATLVVHQGEVYIGLQPDKYISTAGVETLIHMISVDTESQIVPNQTVDVQVVEQRWYSVMEENEMGRAVWTWDLEEIPVELDQASFTTDENGRAEIRFVPPNGGTFKVSAVTRDERGNTIRSSTYVWVGGQREYVAWRPQNNNNFDLITDADEYRVGDTAEILIPSPFQGTATALVTIERAGIFEHEVVKLDNNSPIYKLPITEDYAPDIYVSVMLVKGVDVFSPFAQFRVGVAHLSVNKEQFVLNIDVDSSVAEGDFAGPGDEVTYILTLRSQVYRL